MSNFGTCYLEIMTKIVKLCFANKARVTNIQVSKKTRLETLSRPKAPLVTKEVLSIFP